MGLPSPQFQAAQVLFTLGISVDNRRSGLLLALPLVMNLPVLASAPLSLLPIERDYTAHYTKSRQNLGYDLVQRVFNYPLRADTLQFRDKVSHDMLINNRFNRAPAILAERRNCRLFHGWQYG